MLKIWQKCRRIREYLDELVSKNPKATYEQLLKAGSARLAEDKNARDEVVAYILSHFVDEKRQEKNTMAKGDKVKAATKKNKELADQVVQSRDRAIALKIANMTGSEIRATRSLPDSMVNMIGDTQFAGEVFSAAQIEEAIGNV